MTAQAAHVTKVLGPAVGGALVALLGARGCFIVDALTFLASAAWLVRLPALPRLAGAPPAKTRHDLRVGMQFLWRTPRLRVATLALAACITALGATIPSLPVHARDALGLGSLRIGLLLSMLGAGALFGSMWLVSTRRHVDRSMLVALGALASGLALIGFTRCRHEALAFVAIVPFGAGVSVLLVAAHTLVQEETPAPLRGRVVSLILAVLGTAQVSGMGLASVASVTSVASAAHVTSFTLSLAGGVLAASGALLGATASRRAVRPGAASTRAGSPQ
jgi:predicted MFS family arabinose efflux permease